MDYEIRYSPSIDSRNWHSITEEQLIEALKKSEPAWEIHLDYIKYGREIYIRSIGAYCRIKKEK